MTLGWVPVGECAIRLTLGDGIDPADLARAIRNGFDTIDVVATERDVLVTFDARAPIDPERLARVTVTPGSRQPPREHHVRVRYDGPDLESVCKTLGLTVRELIGRHARPTYTVRVVGFVPGFAYLGDLDPHIAIPRRSTPRARVPAGSVAIAGHRTGIYPFETPGGWHLLGTAVDFRAFDPEHGATFRIGDRVRFEPEP